MQVSSGQESGTTRKPRRKFKEISEAYEILKDPQKRAAYDRFGHAAFENGGGGGGGFSSARDFGSASMRHLRGDVRRVHGRSRAARQPNGGRERGADLRYNMEITLEEAFAGKTAAMRVPTKVACDACTAPAPSPDRSAQTCGDLPGSGRVRAQQGFFSIERTCPTCQGAARSSTTPATTAPARAA
jgi:molecular chaperone DnaJ